MSTFNISSISLIYLQFRRTRTIFTSNNTDIGYFYSTSKTKRIVLLINRIILYLIHTGCILLVVHHLHYFQETKMEGKKKNKNEIMIINYFISGMSKIIRFKTIYSCTRCTFIKTL